MICYTGVGFKQNKLLSSLPPSSIVEATPIKEEKCRYNQCVTLRYTMDDPRGTALNFKLKVTQGLCGTPSSNCETLCDQVKSHSLNNTTSFKKCKVTSCLFFFHYYLSKFILLTSQRKNHCSKIIFRDVLWSMSNIYNVALIENCKWLIFDRLCQELEIGYKRRKPYVVSKMTSISTIFSNKLVDACILSSWNKSK